ncbi:glucose-1-phosphate thymidylyltransferase RfbA [Hellea balneolensis]|uniref:glucose-1-phosphate thymidylyltransferase RfbA n=1 Tax=Hellea balneolensis TaxID=287478 RepID=UPI00040159B7|nr:glucose-1-phosphate thymidylyltransferase RfbA [Hellea balneolensis]
MTSSVRKGIILAGGTGTRLHPSTIAISKQLMPVYDKPMIYYPLSVLMEAGINEIMIITTPHDQAAFKTLLGDGVKWGLSLTYAVQDAPRGIAEALIIAEEFLCGGPSVLILGDNLFFGETFSQGLEAAMSRTQGASVFGYRVNDPQRYGVVEFDESGKVLSIEEKPIAPKSNYAVTGLYFYDSHAPAYAKEIKPSERQELEITALNQVYLSKGDLHVELLGGGTTWLDTGTHKSLFEAAQFVNVVQSRQGIRICCPEVLAYQKGWISRDALIRQAEKLKKSGYGNYLMDVAGLL